MTIRGLFVSTALGLLLLTGCATRVTRENFNVIHPGSDDKEDVRRILGSEYEDDGFGWVFRDDQNQQRCIVMFNDRGVVSAKEWFGEGNPRPSVFDMPENHKGEVIHESSKTRTIDP